MADQLPSARQLRALVSFDCGALGGDQVAEAPEGGASTAGDPAGGDRGTGVGGREGAALIANFLLAAWKHRCSVVACSALDGRGTQGGDSVV